MREAIILAAPFVIVLAALVWCMFFDKFETGSPPDDAQARGAYVESNRRTARGQWHDLFR
jgi:hypothetical protein